MNTTPTRLLLDRFADAMQSNGIALVPVDLLTDLVASARSVDASPIAIDVLVDPTEPTVVRERAFVKIAARLVGRDVGQPAPTSRALTLAHH